MRHFYLSKSDCAKYQVAPLKVSWHKCPRKIGASLYTQYAQIPLDNAQSEERVIYQLICHADFERWEMWVEADNRINPSICQNQLNGLLFKTSAKPQIPGLAGNESVSPSILNIKHRLH
jgi:hypothetical protein